MKIKVIYIVIIALSIIFIVMGLYSNGFFKGEKLVYKGVDYVGADGDYIKDTLIGKTRDGWKLYSIKGDNNNCYIVAKGNRDEFLYVKESYSRKIDKIDAIWFGDNNGHYTENEEIIDYMKSLLKKKSTHKYDINLNEYENGWQKIYGKYAEDPVARVIAYVIPYGDNVLLYCFEDKRAVELSDDEYRLITNTII